MFEGDASGGDKGEACQARASLPLYAAHGIPEVWIVNLVDRQIEIYTDPQGEEFLTRSTVPLSVRAAAVAARVDARAPEVRTIPFRHSRRRAIRVIVRVS